MRNVLYIIILLLLPAYGFAEKTLSETVHHILNDKTIDEPYKRFHIALDKIYEHIHDLPFDEIMSSYKEILLPFVEKNVKDGKKRNKAKALTYLDITTIYLNRTDSERYDYGEQNIKKAIEFAELSEDIEVCAKVYNLYGWLLSAAKSVQLAHEYYYKAMNCYEALNDYEGIFRCLFRIAENFLQTRDHVGLRKLIDQMQQYIKEPSFNESFSCYHGLYTLQNAYYGLHIENHPEITAYHDSALIACRNMIYLIENKMEQQLYVSVAFSYYNVAVNYNRSCPDQYDSIVYFLNKALEVSRNDNEKSVALEVEISVYLLYADLHFAQKKYAQAEKDILYALSLLEQMKDCNTVVGELTEAYKVLTKLYEAMNRPDEALKYHKLLLQNEQKRYDNDKIVTMNDMLAKYETEKKTEQIERLTEQNINSRKILILTMALIAVLFIVLLIIVYVHRLRKKNLEQSVYESALLAELKQNELDAERTRIKQHLEQKPTKAMIEKLTEWITNSAIEKSNKNRYILQLSDLNNDMLEQGFLSADEKISKMEMKYIICFSIDMDVKDMSLLFNVEPASIRTVRYRIKKKFGQKNSFAFLV